MRVLISAGWFGGAGGAERALHSVVRALAHDDVDIVAREHLGGPFAVVGDDVGIHSLLNWRWRASARTSGLKGSAIQKVLNPVRRAVLPNYDVYLQFFSGGNIGPTVNAGVRLLIPSGSHVSGEVASHYDFIALQAPDNIKFAPEGASTVLLPPPLFDLSEHSERPHVDLPPSFYLTVFNAYDPVKGVDDLARAADRAPHPIVWCHSRRTLNWAVPDEVANHPRIVHVDDPTPATMRHLYERCLAYLSFSRSEGFGWSTADGLRYSGAVVSRRVGILTYPEALQEGVHDVGETWEVDFAELPAVVAPVERDLNWVSPARFRQRLLELCSSVP